MPGLIRGVARTAAIAGTATAVSNRVSRRQAGRWAEQDQQAYEQQAPAPPPQAYAPPPQAYAAPPQAYAPPPPPAYEQPAPPPAESEQPDMSAKLAQLQQLGELKAQGILTDEEFYAQKSKILGS